MTGFDDFLGLAGRDLSRFRVVVFHGRSGSGKSTAIRYLLENRFREERTGVIDEITTFRDLVRRRSELNGEGPILVATHVDPRWFRLFVRGPMAVFRTDRDGSKIGRYLARLGIEASPASVELYVRTFGATYTDVDLILERCPSPSFDRALGTFLKFHRIETVSA
jgi:GTPase SAR1 family protein